MTYDELIHELKHLDELTLLEVLDLSSEEIVDMLSDVIWDNQDDLKEKLSDDPQDDE